MPLIIGLKQLADGFEIVTSSRGTFVITSADIPATTKAEGLSAAQTYVDNWFAASAIATVVSCVLTSLEPLQGSITLSDN